ncbi:MAG TPA: hypothetical protein VMY43_06695, partial [Methanothrix sp.]|nr:hypothetical protein [Methanothrix sp.]
MIVMLDIIIEGIKEQLFYALLAPKTFFSRPPAFFSLVGLLATLPAGFAGAVPDFFPVPREVRAP